MLAVLKVASKDGRKVGLKVAMLAVLTVASKDGRKVAVMVYLRVDSKVAL